MLRALPDFPFRSLPDTSLAHADLPLLEIFISRFLGETGALIRKGICSDYLATEGEEPFLRGRLLLREHQMWIRDSGRAEASSVPLNTRNFSGSGFKAGML